MAKRGTREGRWLGSDGAVRGRGPSPGLRRGLVFPGLAIGDSVSSGWPASTLTGTGGAGRARNWADGRRWQAGEASSAAGQRGRPPRRCQGGGSQALPSSPSAVRHSPQPWPRGCQLPHRLLCCFLSAGSSVCSQVSPGVVPAGSWQNEGGRELGRREGGRGGPRKGSVFLY